MPHRSLSNHWLARVAASLVLGLSLAIGVIGCKSQNAADDRLPPQKTALLHQADQMQNDGEDLKNQGMKLRAEGKGGDDLIKQGEQKLVDAEKLREKAMTLKE